MGCGTPGGGGLGTPPLLHPKAHVGAPRSPASPTGHTAPHPERLPPPAKWLTCREERPWPPSCSLNIIHHHPHTAHSCAPHVREAGLRSPRWGTRRCGEGVTVSYRAGPGGAQVPRSGWHPTGGGTLLPGAAGPSPRAAPQAPPPAAAGPRAGTLVSKPEPLGKSESRPPPRPRRPPAASAPGGASASRGRARGTPASPQAWPRSGRARPAAQPCSGRTSWCHGPRDLWVGRRAPARGRVHLPPREGLGLAGQARRPLPTQLPTAAGPGLPGKHIARATSLAGRGPGPRSRQLADSAPRPPTASPLPRDPGTP